MSVEADQTQRFRAEIDAAWPGLIPVGAAIRLTRGQSNDVLIVADALAFRFPRTAASAATLRTEVDLLRALQGRLPLPVPNPEFVRLRSGPLDRDLAGYRLLPGEALTRAAVSSRTPSNVAYLAEQIAAFLRELHARPASGLPPLPAADAPADWANLLVAFENELFPYMRPDARIFVTASFAAFLDTAGDSDFSPVLRHGDLGGENIRYDPATNKVTGIIDFASAAIGDPAVDLAGLSWYGETFVEALAACYPALADPGLRMRAAFYRSTFALQQALWAIRAGDAAEFEDGIAGYR